MAQTQVTGGVIAANCPPGVPLCAKAMPEQPTEKAPKPRPTHLSNAPKKKAPKKTESPQHLSGSDSAARINDLPKKPAHIVDKPGLSIMNFETDTLVGHGLDSCGNPSIEGAMHLPVLPCVGEFRDAVLSLLQDKKLDEAKLKKAYENLLQCTDPCTDSKDAAFLSSCFDWQKLTGILNMVDGDQRNDALWALTAAGGGGAGLGCSDADIEDAILKGKFRNLHQVEGDFIGIERVGGTMTSDEEQKPFKQTMLLWKMAGENRSSFTAAEKEKIWISPKELAEGYLTGKFRAGKCEADALFQEVEFGAFRDIVIVADNSNKDHAARETQAAQLIGSLRAVMTGASKLPADADLWILPTDSSLKPVQINVHSPNALEIGSRAIANMTAYQCASCSTISTALDSSVKSRLHLRSGRSLADATKDGYLIFAEPNTPDPGLAKWSPKALDEAHAESYLQNKVDVAHPNQKITIFKFDKKDTRHRYQLVYNDRLLPESDYQINPDTGEIKLSFTPPSKSVNTLRIIKRKKEE